MTRYDSGVVVWVRFGAGGIPLVLRCQVVEDRGAELDVIRPLAHGRYGPATVYRLQIESAP